MSFTKKQMELRKTGIGASEIAALAGLSKYATPVQIFERKTGAAPDENNLRMELGNLLEDPIAKLYAKRTGLHLLKCETLRHPTESIALATPDRLVFPERTTKAQALEAKPLKLLQVKTTGWRQRAEWGREGTDEIPEDYLAQVQWEMMVADVDACDVAVLVDRDEFLIYTVRRDRDLADGLLQLARKFWTENVETRTPPPPDASEQYAAFLARAHPRHTSEEIVALDVNDAEHAAIDLASAMLRDTEKEIDRLTVNADELKNTLRAFIGDRAGFVGTFGRVTWKAAKPTEVVDWKEAAHAMRDQVAGWIDSERAGSALEAETEANRIFAEAIGKATSVKAGSRRLLKKWNG